jgi:Na+-transporting NADH:ubiquinone oxidoreductase subunit A
MTPITIKHGMNIPLAGGPKSDLAEIPQARVVAVQQEEEGLKVKLLVKEGDAVKRGSPLFVNKRLPELQFCSPASGTVRAIEYGPRRALDRVVIDADTTDEAIPFPTYKPDQLLGISRDDALNNLLQSGLLALIRQRPFARIADPAAKPKSIFVNGMNTAPFLPDLHVAVKGQERFFQAGLDVLARLTEGPVHLCLSPAAAHASPAVTQAARVKIHTFEGPHPSGNTSVHIFHIDPMEPHDIVWTIRGVDVLRIGRLFLEGAWPADKVICLAGPGVKPEAAQHYRIKVGTPLSELLDGRLTDVEQRIIGGDALSGQTLPNTSFLRSANASITVLPEGREQYFLGWMAPGINKYSKSRAYLSGWFGQRRPWAMDTNLNGSYRSMVLTGLYDKYVPMNMMVDYLVRAVLAHDTDEAIQLGILGTDPEDFALCSFVCPSKMDISGVIKQGLNEIEKEGI